MKLTHRHKRNSYSENMTGKLDPAYEREVELATNKLEVKYAAAQRRLEAAEKQKELAEKRLAAAHGKKTKAEKQKEFDRILQEYIAREEELQEIIALMNGTPASSVHRGNKSHRSFK
jgi:acyl-CoA reductase-like NAD-dependent aldehyde dehydrogenase